MPRDNQTEFLQHILQGNQSAISFLTTLGGISQVVDDLVDGDKPVSIDGILALAWDSLVTIPENEFYRNHYAQLQPLVSGALASFQDSVRLERVETDDPKPKQIAFIIRSSLMDITIKCAYLVGGYKWMTQVSPQIRDHIHEDDYETYLTDLVVEKAKREGTYDEPIAQVEAEPIEN